MSGTIEFRFAVLIVLVATLSACGGTGEFEGPVARNVTSEKPEFTGSESCRGCHERFYQLWAPSHHGLAMQPFTPEFSQEKFNTDTGAIRIGFRLFEPVVDDGEGWIVERSGDGDKKYRIEQVMGGKNVYFFLTELERGHLQVLPIAYDVRKKEWYDTTGSMLRHFSHEQDEPVEWEDRLLTFNTSCFNCHVSQLATNYDSATDSYNTIWAEPGINCETCHEGASEHIRVCREAPEGTTPEDLKIIRVSEFAVDQVNALCTQCHAKRHLLTTSFRPGDRYFDHFGLTTLEHPDYYPDGRDLGENYTLTSWLMSPCVASGELDCLHCHTSSGRYRFADDDKANDACLPCHEERRENITGHTRHKEGSEGNKCISCHMPKTTFARMVRSDHSMLPPTPSATIAHESPNACNVCHADKSPEWADTHVREWRGRDYQAPVLYRAGLIEAARKTDWSRLSEMLEYLKAPERDSVTAASLIRLLEACESPTKWPVLLEMMKDPSPLVRASAAISLGMYPTRESLESLIEASEDEYRLVRVRAASGLAGFPPEWVAPSNKQRVDRALEEYKASLMSVPDDWSSHYNLGNYHSGRGELKEALISYETAARLRPDQIHPLVNAAMAHARLGDYENTEKKLRAALALDADDPATNFNLGLLLAEQEKPEAAESCFRTALKTDPQFAEAAYNLGILLATDRIEESIRWLEKACGLRPENPEYAYTLAYFLRQSGDLDAAAEVLKQLIERYPNHTQARMLLEEVRREEPATSS